MADRGHAAQQVFERAPPEPYRFGHAQLLTDRTAAGMVDVARPGGGIRVGAPAQLREEVELQVVVGVDQTRHDKMAGEIEVVGAWLLKLWGRQSCLQPPFRRLFGPCACQGPAESRLQPGLAAPHTHRRTHRVSSTAGVRQADANNSGRPAASKSARSGSPIVASAHSASSRSAAARR